MPNDFNRIKLKVPPFTIFIVNVISISCAETHNLSPNFCHFFQLFFFWFVVVVVMFFSEYISSCLALMEVSGLTFVIGA